MSAFKIVLIVYGLLMLGGGYMGYAKAGSKMSLIMGIISGILIFVGVALMGGSTMAGTILVTGVAAALSAVFLIRFMKTKAFMPSGMLLVLSVVVFIICLMEVMKQG